MIPRILNALASDTAIMLYTVAAVCAYALFFLCAGYLLGAATGGAGL